MRRRHSSTQPKGKDTINNFSQSVWAEDTWSEAGGKNHEQGEI